MMGAFTETIGVIKAKVMTRSQAVFVNTASHAYESIVNGSATTGAPGQPVDQGILKASWQLSFPDKTSALITTDSPYARQNEDGIARPGGGPYVQRSPVGGRHSIALTVAGLDKIVAFESAKVAANG